MCKTLRRSTRSKASKKVKKSEIPNLRREKTLLRGKLLQLRKDYDQSKRDIESKLRNLGFTILDNLDKDVPNEDWDYETYRLNHGDVATRYFHEHGRYEKEWKDLVKKHMPPCGVGETRMSQLISGANKFQYRWNNDGDHPRVVAEDFYEYANPKNGEDRWIFETFLNNTKYQTQKRTAMELDNLVDKVVERVCELTKDK